MNLIVQGIPPLTTSYDLTDYFKVFGPVEKAYVMEDVGYVHMINRDDGIKILNTMRNLYMSGRRIFVELDSGMGMNREREQMPYHEPMPNPYSGWTEIPRDVGHSYDYGMPQERFSKTDVDPWKQVIPEQNLNGSRSDERLITESYVYVDPHGYSRDPTMRPAPEYYYRIKLLDSKSKHP